MTKLFGIIVFIIDAVLLKDDAETISTLKNRLVRQPANYADLDMHFLKHA